MVVIHHFQDILENLDKIDVITLPKCKESSLSIEFFRENDEQDVLESSVTPLPFASSEVYDATIIKSRRLTAEDGGCKAVYEITFDIEGSNFNFKPGDTIGIIPHNTQHEVEQIIDHLGLKDVVDCNYALSIRSGQKGKIPLHVPQKSTLRHVLTGNIDLRGVLKKLFLLALSQHTKDVNEKKVLEYLCSTEGSAAYTTHILNKNFTLLDLFGIFKSCKPPIEIILEHLPKLLPRPYSIVNRFCNENILKICFSVINIGNRKGLTTGWLEEMILSKNNIERQMENLSLKRHNKIPMYLRKNINEFSLPESTEKPLILIGPGTGIAPFIGFLEERYFLKKFDAERKFGFVWLFFGCRDPKLDFIYEEELKKFHENNVINKISIAFSRVENAEYCYVQDAIKHNGDELTKLIMQGAHIYVCGDIKVMAKQVEDSITQIIEQNCKFTAKEMEDFISKMQKEKRYINDIWN